MAVALACGVILHRRLFFITVDLLFAILAELLTRVQYREGEQAEFAPLYPILSLLSYMLKAPLVKPGAFVRLASMFV